MLKTQAFQARVGKVETVGKVVKVTLGTSRNKNAGKKEVDGSWVEAEWVYSNWFATFFGEDAKRIGVGDVLLIEEAQLSKEMYENKGEKTYPMNVIVFDGKWKWKSKSEKDSGAKTESKQKTSEPVAEDEEDNIPF